MCPRKGLRLCYVSGEVSKCTPGGNSVNVRGVAALNVYKNRNLITIFCACLLLA